MPVHSEPRAGMILTPDRLTEWIARGQLVGFWRRTNAQQLINENDQPASATAIAWDNTVFDDLDAGMDPPDNARIAPTMPGLYLLAGAIGWGANTSGTQRGTAWRLNGDAITAGRSIPITTSSIPNVVLSTLARATIVELDGQGDYVDLVGMHNASSQTPTSSTGRLEPYMTLTYVGPPSDVPR